MDEFARYDHGDQDLVLKSHQLLDYVDFGVHNYILQQNYVITRVSLDVILEFGDLYDVDGTLALFQFRNHVFLPDIALSVEGVFNRLVLDEQCFQDRNVLLLCDRVNVITVWLHQPNHGTEFGTDYQQPISIWLG